MLTRRRMLRSSGLAALATVLGLGAAKAAEVGIGLAEKALDGVIWAPYVPFLKGNTYTQWDSPRRGVMTRYAKTKLNTSYYSTVTIVDAKVG